MRRIPACAAIVLAATLSACAHPPQGATGPADYSPIAGEPAPPNARYYAECIGQAAASGRFRRASDGGGDELILFTCTGAPARAFWDALGPWSVAHDSAFAHAGRRYRSTARVVANMYGVDSCSVDASDSDPRCVITFNAGDFLDGQ